MSNALSSLQALGVAPLTLLGGVVAAVSKRPFEAPLKWRAPGAADSSK
jgi:hypothetical protein